jgi:hypothetical protein
MKVSGTIAIDTIDIATKTLKATIKRINKKKISVEIEFLIL